MSDFYPTKEEYFNEIARVQKDELSSDIYKIIYSFMANSYWNREYKDVENKLFQIIDTYSLSSFSGNDYFKSIGIKKYEALKQFISLLTPKQIDSNIYLKCAFFFMNSSIEDCLNIMNELNSKMNVNNTLKSITLEIPISSSTQANIPGFVNTQVGIKYYRPDIYKTKYVDVLDSKHRIVYEEYNNYVSKVCRLAESIYFLQMNSILVNIPSINCYRFEIFHPGFNNHFIVSFFIKSRLRNDNTFYTDEFVQTTISNFKMLVDNGIIDLSNFNNGSSFVLKK